MQYFGYSVNIIFVIVALLLFQRIFLFHVQFANGMNTSYVQIRNELASEKLIKVQFQVAMSGRYNNQKQGPKEESKRTIPPGKESDKSSWFDQEPLTSSASAKDPQCSNIIVASSLKIKVSADRKQDCSSESDGTDTKARAIALNRNFEIINKPTDELISAIRVFFKLSVDSWSCFLAFFPALPFYHGFFLCLWQLCPRYCLPAQSVTEQNMKLHLPCDTFSRNSWSIVIDPGRSHCPIGLRFQEAG